MVSALWRYLGQRSWSRIRVPLRLWLVCFGVVVLSACSAPQVGDYAKETPVLDLRQYLSGNLTAHGIFTDRSGKVVRRFTVQMQGKWEGDQGVLDEQFLYSDGSTGQRVWHLTYLGNGQYQGTASDVNGTAVGETAGNAFHWKYSLQLPVDGRVWDVNFDDWMYLVDDKVMLNKAVMSKWGVSLGEVTLVFNK